MQLKLINVKLLVEVIFFNVKSFKPLYQTFTKRLQTK